MAVRIRSRVIAVGVACAYGVELISLGDDLGSLWVIQEWSDRAIESTFPYTNHRVLLSGLTLY